MGVIVGASLSGVTVMSKVWSVVVDGDRDGDGSAVLVEGGRRFDGPVAAAQVDEVEVAVGNDAGVTGSRRDHVSGPSAVLVEGDAVMVEHRCRGCR